MYRYGFLIFVWSLSTLCAQSIEDKKQFLQEKSSPLGDLLDQKTKDFNRQYREMNLIMRDKTLLLKKAYGENKSLETIDFLRQEIQLLRQEIRDLGSLWKEDLQHLGEQAPYALWHHENIRLDRLLAEYGSQDFVYLIPEDIASMSLHLSSDLPVPSGAWPELLELLLQHNGIAHRDLGPYLRELHRVDASSFAFRVLTTSREDLQRLAPEEILCFLMEDRSGAAFQDIVKQIALKEQIRVENIGQDLLLLGKAEALRELLRVYDFFVDNKSESTYALIPLQAVDAEEITSVLEMFFRRENSFVEGKKGSRSPLQIISLSHKRPALFIMGAKTVIQQAKKIVKDLEEKLREGSQKKLHWYSCRYSDPRELATLLSQAYSLMQGESIELPTHNVQEEKSLRLGISPQPISGIKKQTSVKAQEGNFLVDEKTGTLVMVVEQALWPQLKKLLKKIDVPKKMVRIDVLLFEKKARSESQFGLRSLGVGALASGIRSTALSWAAPDLGVLDFSLSRQKRGRAPAYGLAYRFLLAREDISVNANPSLLTLNQVPASIHILQERSVETGVHNTGTEENPRLIRSYERMQYGIWIEIKPTIHIPASPDEKIEVTLDTQITFDTPGGSNGDRPDVDRRQIQSQVRIVDGETLVLGGLRTKKQQDRRESIPFLGDLPGLGKLFRYTRLEDDSSEMFILLTPHVEEDQLEKRRQSLITEMQKRPGDVPAFLSRLLKAKRKKKMRGLSQSMQLMLGGR